MNSTIPLCRTCTALNCQIRQKFGEQDICRFYVADLVAAGLWPTDPVKHLNVTSRKGGDVPE